jgi:glyoxylase-like metal-dependent hydrolase (beta-lactamase superfamily II)
LIKEEGVKIMIKISDRIYYLPHSEEVVRPTLGYIRGDKYVLMIDAGNSAKQVNIYLQKLNELNLPHPDYVAVTHWHFDHTYGLSALHIPAIACKETNIHLKEMTSWKWDDESMSQRVKELKEPKACQEYIKAEYTDLNLIKVRTADIVFHKFLSLDLGGITCEMMWVDSSHTNDCVLYFIPEEKFLFVGDADYCNSKEEGHAYEKEKLQKFITLVESLDFDTVVNGHSAHESKESAMSDYYDILRDL